MQWRRSNMQSLDGLTKVMRRKLPRLRLSPRAIAPLRQAHALASVRHGQDGRRSGDRAARSFLSRLRSPEPVCRRRQFFAELGRGKSSALDRRSGTAGGGPHPQGGASCMIGQRRPSSACRHNSPSLSLRAFVVRKAKQLAFRPLRGPRLTPVNGEKKADRNLSASLAIGESGDCSILRPVTIRGEVPGRAMRGSADLHKASLQ